MTDYPGAPDWFPLYINGDNQREVMNARDEVFATASTRANASRIVLIINSSVRQDFAPTSSTP